MPRKDGTTSRKHVSVKGKTFATLSVVAKVKSRSVSGVLEELIAAYLDKQETMRPTGAKGSEP